MEGSHGTEPAYAGAAVLAASATARRGQTNDVVTHSTRSQRLDVAGQPSRQPTLRLANSQESRRSPSRWCTQHSCQPVPRCRQNARLNHPKESTMAKGTV